MKKMLFLVSLLICLFLSGCDNKQKIECAYYEENDGKKITYDYFLNFDDNGNILKNIEVFSTYEFQNEMDLDRYSDIDICNMIISDTVDNYNKFIICDSKNYDDKINVNIKYDYEKMNDEQKKLLLGNFTYDEFKEKYKNNKLDKDICLFDSNKDITPTLYNDGILGLLADYNKKLIEKDVYKIIEIAENYIVDYLLRNNGKWDSNIVFTCNGKKCSTIIDGEKENLNLKSVVPTSGEILVSSQGVKITKPLIIKGYECTMNDDDEVECLK